MPTRRTELLARPAMSSGEGSPAEGDNAQREIGLAVYTSDVDCTPITRSFLFRDDLVERYSEDSRANNGRDDRSVCTLFEDCDHQERSKHVCHCYKNTQIDQKSSVYNGSIVGAETSDNIRKHHLNGGSVKNESKLVNGDLDRETFLAFFCNGSTERPSTSRT